MSKNDKAGKPQAKKNQPKGKDAKKGNRFSRLGQRIVTFFRNQNAELKRVTWPSKAKTLKTTAVVLVISLGVTVLIWVADTILRETLIASGFDIPRDPAGIGQETTETTEPTVEVTEPDETTEADQED